MTASFGFEMGFSIILEKADIIYNSTGLPTLKIYPADAPAFGPVLEKTDGYQLEINHFVNRLKGRKVPRIITNEQSMNSVKLVLAEKRSALAGREVVIR